LSALPIVRAVALVAATLAAVASACGGGEVLPIGSDDLLNPLQDAGPDVTTHDDAQPGNGGEPDAFSGFYDSGPIPSYDGSDFYDTYEPYDVWDYDAANWPSTATLGCTTDGDDCSCERTVNGHDYTFRCSDFTATCDCLVDNVLQATELGDTVCAPSDASVSPLQIQWVIGCFFPQ
jgi:hypothetical protein